MVAGLYLLGIRLIARSGLSTLTVRMVLRLSFSTSKQYSRALKYKDLIDLTIHITNKEKCLMPLKEQLSLLGCSVVGKG